MVKVVITDQSMAFVQTCIDKATRSSSSVRSLSFPSRLRLPSSLAECELVSASSGDGSA
jgi:hypothetical protein